MTAQAWARVTAQIAVGGSVCFLLIACRCLSGTDDSASIEDAKKRPIVYRSINGGAPPRDISDIRALLAQSAEKPSVPEAAAKVAQQPPQTTNNRELARFYWERGRAASELGMTQLELDDLRRAAEYSKGLDTQDVEEDRIIQELAAAESRSGNLLNAVQMREYAIELARKRNTNFGVQVSAYKFLVEARLELGERDKAREALAKAESLLVDLRSKRNFSWFRYNWPTWPAEAKAAILESEGKYAEAEALRRQVVNDRRQDIDMNKERLERGLANISPLIVQRVYGLAQRKLALNLVKQQRLPEAEGIMRKRVYGTLKNRGRYFVGTGAEIKALSDVLYEQGRYAEARELAETAQDIFAKLEIRPESSNVIGARRARAAALTAEGRYAEAIAEMERMQQGLAGNPTLLARLGNGDLDWTLALIRTGAANKAVPMAGEILSDRRERLGNDHTDTAEALGFLAMAQAASGAREEALRNYAAALPILMASNATTDGANRSAARIRRMVLIAEGYIELLADAHASGLAGKLNINAMAEAFRFADFARGSSVQRALSSTAARSAATDPKLAELVQREQAMSREFAATQDLLLGLLAAAPDKTTEENAKRLREEAKKIARERHELYARIVREFPAFAELINPQPATLDKTRASLAPGEVLLSVYVTENRSFIWAVPKEGNAVFASAPLGEQKLAESVARLRKAVDSSAPTLGAMPSFDVAEGWRLYEALLKPVEGAWKSGDTLLVVPHRALAQLPLAMLLTAPVALKPDQKLLFDAHRNVPWLVRKVAVVQLPTANAAITLRALPPGDPARRAFAGFGDPLFSAQQAAEAATAAKPTQIASRGVATRSLPLPRRNLAVARVSAATSGEEAVAASNVANSSALAQVPRLPDTADEILEIAAALKADLATDVFLQLRATEDMVKTTPLGDRRVLVFATHGLVPGELNGLNQPALAMTAPELAKETGDGLLTMEEVLGLKLNADWIVLSACNTAAGEGGGGEAISGLGRAFFYAGSRALLVTQWPVETTSARALTTGVFRRQAETPGLTRAQALRETMLAMIDGPGYVDPASGKSVFAYAHPLFWAPYTLVGDGGK